MSNIFKPTAAQRSRVSILAAARMPKVDIAHALDVDQKTLNKYFAWELSEGIAERNAEVLAAMFRMAKRGNVAAQKAWLARQDVMPETPATLAEPKPVKIGKKAEAEIAAETAHEGNDWGNLVRH